MSKHIATLNYGNIEDVSYILDQFELDESDLRAALLNAFRRIEQLNKALQRLYDERI